jgi:hypothetical protein
LTITVKYQNGAQLGPQFRAGVQRFKGRATVAIQQAARAAAADIEAEGRRNIADGGNFTSARWQDGFAAKVSYQSSTDLSIRVTHSVPYWVVFEEGRVIQGKPLLWIPLTFGNAKGVRARDYPGPLFRVNRKGKNPLLMDVHGPQYVGVSSVTLRRRWHLRDIVKRIARNMRQYYKEAMRSG